MLKLFLILISILISTCFEACLGRLRLNGKIRARLQADNLLTSLILLIYANLLTYFFAEHGILDSEGSSCSLHHFLPPFDSKDKLNSEHSQLQYNSNALGLEESLVKRVRDKD